MVVVKAKLRKKLRSLKKRFRRNWPAVSAGAVVVLMGFLAYFDYMESKKLVIDPAAYSSLLQLIAEAESNGNYNAYFSNASNTQVRFTEMTIAEVMSWQRDFLAQGNASSAVGRYQIIDSTLNSLVGEMSLDLNEKFDERTQDEMAAKLLERRGSVAYVNNELSSRDFAANLAKEWAALPKVVGDNPEESYYASDGLNKSHVSTSEILGAIDGIKVK